MKLLGRRLVGRLQATHRDRFYAGGRAYEYAPQTGKWLLITKKAEVEPARDVSDPVLPVDFLTGVVAIASWKEGDRVRDVPATRVDAQADLAVVVDALPRWIRADMRNRGDRPRMRALPLAVWLNAEGCVLRLSHRLWVPSPRGLDSLWNTVEFFDFGVALEPPDIS
jgi:hypothetical protein